MPIGGLSRYKGAMPQTPGPNRRDKRPDGSYKGTGFLGVLNRTGGGGISTEISIGANIDGQEVEIPTMVPTLDHHEIKYLLSPEMMDDSKPIPESIIKKAIDHARKRMAQGLSPFKQSGE